ncbi:MAG: hypothetical protein E7256_16090 [Lachnospiraceae bacterium]|nr:hypothetical protein [Lachnospiraceae bacterium]
MKVWKQVKEDQRGSTLLLVLVCMAFVGVLGTTMLSVALLNYQMKAVSSEEKDTFYTAETALEEFGAAMEEISYNALEEAYEYMLTTYSLTAAPERAGKLAEKFADLLYQALTISSGGERVFRYGEDISGLVSSPGVRLAAVPIVQKYEADNQVVLKNVILIYTDATGYETMITTDIHLGIDFPTVSTNKTVGRGVFYTEYAIIADQYIRNVTTAAHTIEGNVFAGKGVVLNGTAISSRETMSVKADLFITKDIIVNDKASFQLKNRTDGKMSELWVNSLETASTTSTSEHLTYMDIKADCYVADDLTLNASNGAVIISGNYYGYQSSGTREEESSAINVNAKGAILDLRNVAKLWVAGKTFLAVPSIYGSTSEQADYKQVGQGESISYKGFQNAYLVPGECIVGIGHNPMTEAEFSKIRTEDSGVSINLLKSFYNGGVDLSGYVNPDKPYQEVAVRFSGAPTMYYLYLNFIDANAASDYFAEYYSTYKKRVEKEAEMLDTGRILFNAAGEMLTNTGNVISFTEDGVSITERSKSIYDDAIYMKEEECSKQYRNLRSGLDKNDSYGSTDSLASNLIRYDRIPETGITKADRDKTVYVSKKTDPVTIDSSLSAGIIITAGDVNVYSHFSGLIITKGNINFYNEAAITAAGDMVTELINTVEWDDGLKLCDLFYDYVSVGDVIIDNSESVEAKIVISYENWKKN